MIYHATKNGSCLMDDRTVPLLEDQTNRSWQFNVFLDPSNVLIFLLSLILFIYNIPKLDSAVVAS